VPKFYKQNKKRIDPRYFLEETASRDRVDEDLKSSLFLKARESAELDILSYFAMPSKQEAEEMKPGTPAREPYFPESKRPELWELRDYLIHEPSSRKTSGFDYSQFKKSPVPEDQARKMSGKVGLDYDWIMKSTSSPNRSQQSKDKWPLPGIDLTNYMVYWMKNNGTLAERGNKLEPTAVGAKRFHELLGSKQAALPGTIQGGDDAKWDKPDKKTSGRKFDPSSWTEAKGSGFGDGIPERKAVSLVSAAVTAHNKKGGRKILPGELEKLKDWARDNIVGDRETDAKKKINKKIRG